MKIGIVTFHRALNFGSSLQAYALCDVLKKMGHEPVIIDYIFKKDMKQYRLFRTHIYRERPQALLGDIVYFFRNLERKRAFNNFRIKYLPLTNKTYISGISKLDELNRIFDAFICGSDQIWNINCTGEVVGGFFLDFVDDKKLKVAYAPSMPTSIEKCYYEDVRKLIEKISYVSVREEQTISYLKNSLKVRKNIAQTVDPTMLLDENEYIHKFNLQKKDEDYIFVYILGDTSIKDDIIDFTIKLKSMTCLKIKYVFIRRIKQFVGEKYCFGIGPLEFLDLIYNARYIVTDSFHATVFALQFKRQLCVFPREGAESRMISLLEKLDMMEFYNRQIDGFKKEIPYKNDFKKLKDKLTKESSDFLNNSFEIRRIR